MAGKNDELVKVESQAPFRFVNIGDSIEGTVKAISRGNYENNIYTIDTKDGEKRVFGSAMLDRQCAQVGIQLESVDGKDVAHGLGTHVRFVYNGMARTSKGFPMKVFDVFAPSPKE